MNNKTAILIFGNSAEKEAELKPFKSSKNLFEALNEHTLNTVKKTNLPYYLFSEKQQIGNSFGERFTNAIQFIYNQGFETVITIGNDTPHLNADHILNTVVKLQTHDLVLGPSTDGGFYLMGLKKSHFNAETFLKLPWQTTSLNRSISKLLASKKIQISYLEPLSDIDALSDIKKIIDSFKKLKIALIKILLQCVFIKKEITSSICLFIKNFKLEHHFNKGSPIPFTNY